jgi:hypothetical protein
MALTQRQKKIFEALNALSRVATAREIERITGENVNGVMQTLNHLENTTFLLDGKNFTLLKEEIPHAEFYLPNPDRFWWRLEKPKSTKTAKRRLK